MVLVLALSAATAAFAAGAADRGTAAPKTFTVWTQSTDFPKDNEGKITKFITARTGVAWKVLSTGGGGTADDFFQLLTLRLASNDLPDAIKIHDDANRQRVIAMLLTQKQIPPIEKYFSDARYARLAQIPKSVVQWNTYPDGHLYNIPRGFRFSPDRIQRAGGFGPGIFINTRLLDKAGMSFLDVTTLDGLEQFLARAKTLTTGQGAPVIPIGFGENFEGWDFLMAMFGVSEWNTDGSAAIPWYREPGAREAMAWVTTLYRKGLMDREAAVNKGDLFDEKIQTGKFAVVFGNGWRIHGASKILLDNTALDAFYMPMRIPAVPDVAQPAAVGTVEPLGSPRGGFIVTNACKDRDAVMRWADYLLSPEGVMVTDWGLQDDPQGWSKRTDGRYETRHESVWSSGKVKDAIRDWGFFFWSTLLTYEKDDIDWVFPNQPPQNRPIVDNYLMRAKEGTMVASEAWRHVTVPSGSSLEKYAGAQADIRTKYFAKMMAAKSDAEFDAAWAGMIGDLVATGHSDDTENEFAALYKEYFATPAGKVKVEMNQASLTALTQAYDGQDHPYFQQLKKLKYDEAMSLPSKLASR
jgi:ABC-type glycerol-3-phosphate transport system substrate-binding protein